MYLIGRYLSNKCFIDFRKIISSLVENNRVICYEGKSLLIYFKSKFGLEFNNQTMIDVKVSYFNQVSADTKYTLLCYTRKTTPYNTRNRRK